jgi:hypothetical protein
MEWIVACICIGGAVGYAVILGRAIEAGKPWAIEIARAVSALDSTYGERVLRQIPANPQGEGVKKRAMAPEPARLAA